MEMEMLKADAKNEFSKPSSRSPMMQRRKKPHSMRPYLIAAISASA